MNNVLKALREKTFRKFIIGAALKDFQAIEDYSYLFTHAGADVLDISAFPHSVLCAQKGIRKAISEDPELQAPLIMVSVNIGEDHHFRRVDILEDACTNCMACVPSCPSGALKAKAEGLLSYEEDLCFGCLLCVNDCNFSAIEINSWSAFDVTGLSMQALIDLGVQAIEIHLNNDLQAFERFYRGLDSKLLESFCLSSAQMSDSEILLALEKVLYELELKHGKNQAFIIQADGNPLSGAEGLDDKDLAGIKTARLIINKLPKDREIFVQISGGVTERSMKKALSLNVPINGIAIGSYARKKLKASLDSGNLEKAKELAKIVFGVK